MPLSVILGLIVFAVGLVCLVAWTFSGQVRHQSAIHSKVNALVESPEWLALVAQRQEIEGDVNLTPNERLELLANWRLEADLTRSAQSRAPNPQADSFNTGQHNSVLLGFVLVGVSATLLWAMGALKPQALVWRSGAQYAQSPSASLQGPKAEEILAAQKGHPGDGQPLETRAEALQARLRDQPEDVNGWVLLARTQAALSQYSESALSLRRALALVPNHPTLLADLADMLAMAQGRVMKGEPAALVELALQQNPQHEKALALAATAAEQAGDVPKAQAYWAALSEVQSQSIRPQPSPQDAKVLTTAKPSEAALLTLTLNWTSADQQQTPSQAAVFVVLKAQPGAGMPLAALRIPVAQLKLGTNPLVLNTSHLLGVQSVDALPDKLYAQARLALTGQVQAHPQDRSAEWIAVERSQLGERLSKPVSLPARP